MLTKWGSILLLMATLSLLTYPVVGWLALLGAALFVVGLWALPKLEEKAHELQIAAEMRHVALLFSANLIAVGSFERALEKTLSAVKEAEIKEGIRRYLLGGKLEGTWVAFFDFVKEVVKGGRKESVERVLEHYLKTLEEYFKESLAKVVEPVKVFMAVAILLPIMVMVAIPIFSLFSIGDVESITYFFVFLLPSAYLLFLLYVKFAKPRLSTKRVSYPLWPFLLLLLVAFLSYLLPPHLIPIAIALSTLLTIPATERVLEERPWQTLHPSLARVALYMQEGYSFEYSLSKAGLNPFKDLPKVLEVVRESSERSTKEGGRVAEKLAEMLEKAEALEERFREGVEEVISTLKMVEHLVLPLVGGATLAFTISLFQYLHKFGDLVQLEGVELKPLVWSFSIYTLESIIITHLLREALEGKEGWSIRGIWVGGLVMALSFTILYLFIQSLMGL